MTDITNKRMTDPPPPPSTKLPRVSSMSSMSSMVTVAKAGRPFCDICNMTMTNYKKLASHTKNHHQVLIDNNANFTNLF